MFSMFRIVGLMSVVGLLSACGGGGGNATATVDEDGDSINVVDASSFSEVLNIGNTESLEGAIPAPAETSSRALVVQDEVVFTTGSESVFTVEVPLDRVGDEIFGLFIQLDGVDDSLFVPVMDGASVDESYDSLQAHRSFKTVKQPKNLSTTQCVVQPSPCKSVQLTGQALSSNAAIASRRSFPVTIQALTSSSQNASSASFSSLASSASNWTQPATLNFSAMPVTSGDIQVTLTWNTDADLDLFVLEPSGFEISWNDRQSTSGGYLDLDDKDGFGPENIVYPSSPTAGTYTVYVGHQSGTLPTNYTLTITQNGQMQTTSGVISAYQSKVAADTIVVSASSSSSSSSSGSSSSGSTSSSSGSSSSGGSSGSGTPQSVTMLFEEGDRKRESFDGKGTNSGAYWSNSTSTCGYHQFYLYATVTESQGVYSIEGSVRIYSELGNNIVSDTPMNTSDCPGQVSQVFSETMIETQENENDSLGSSNPYVDVLQFETEVDGRDMICNISTPLGSSSRLWCESRHVFNWQTYQALNNKL